MNDVVIQFARLWGQKEGSCLSIKDEMVAKELKQYDSEELLGLLSEWAEEYFASDIEDSVDFFESKIEKLCRIIDPNGSIKKEATVPYGVLYDLKAWLFVNGWVLDDAKGPCEVLRCRKPGRSNPFVLYELEFGRIYFVHEWNIDVVAEWRAFREKRCREKGEGHEE